MRPVTSAREARNLSREALGAEPPIHLEAVVLVHHLARPVGQFSMLFVHDGTEGIFVNAMGLTTSLEPGTRVRVTGKVIPGEFAPAVGEGRVEVLGEGTLPEARSTSYDDLLSGKEDSQWIRLRGIVRAVSLVDGQIRFELAVGTREVPVYVSGHVDAIPPEAELVDAEVAVTGAGITGFNPQGQILSALMLTPSIDMIEVESPAPPLEELPERDVDRLLSFRSDGISGHRVKVRGIVTYSDPSGSVYLTNQGESLCARTVTREELEPGTRVEAVGFPKPGLAAPVLDYTTFRVLGRSEVPEPAAVDPEQVMSGEYEASLVRIDALLLEKAARPFELRLLMGDGDSVFPARLFLHSGQPVPDLEVGSRLQLTGIALTEGGVERRGGAGFRPAAWQIILRSPSDITILQRPGWWTMRRVLFVSAVLAAVLLGTFLWGVALKRRVAAQTTVIQDQTQREATLEERNRIARELHDTLAQGFAGTAFTLEGIESMLQQEDHPVRPHVGLALNMVRHSLAEARRSVMNLRSEALENRNLAEALEETAGGLVDSSNITLKTDFEMPAMELSPDEEFHLYRIGMEAVVNGIRHADPRSIEIRIRGTDRFLELEVRDDGSGFDPVQPSDGGHFGVLGMRERARLIGARLEVESRAGAGTRIVATLDRDRPEGGRRVQPEL